MRAFRAGAAKIACDYWAEDGNPGALRIVPVGILYSDKDRFRSRVRLRFGEPLEVAAWCDAHRDNAIDQLTAELEARVRALTVNFETRRESVILTWAAEVMVGGGRTQPPWHMPSVPRRTKCACSRLQAGYQQLVREQPDEIAALTTRVRQYRTARRAMASSRTKSICRSTSRGGCSS